MSMFIGSNTFVNTNSSRPTHVKIEELDHQNHIKIFYQTKIDLFDTNLYEKCVKLNNNKIIKENLLKNDSIIFKYKNSQILYSLDYNDKFKIEKFDNLSNRKLFNSVPSLGNMVLRSKYKMKLAKVYKNEKSIKNNNFEIFLNDDSNIYTNKRNRKSSIHASHNTTLFDNLELNEREKKFFESAMTRKSFTKFTPTHSIIKSESNTNIKNNSNISNNINSRIISNLNLKVNLFILYF